MRATADTPAVHGSFVLIENLDNRANTRIVRVAMESQAVDVPLYNVSVGGADADAQHAVIDFGDVYFNAVTHRVRFFVVRNVSDQLLNFNVSDACTTRVVSNSLSLLLVVVKIGGRMVRCASQHRDSLLAVAARARFCTLFGGRSTLVACRVCHILSSGRRQFAKRR